MAVKALTLHQPWASLVAVGAKTIETCSWPTSYRGRLLIHAGKQAPESGMYGDYEVRRMEIDGTKGWWLFGPGLPVTGVLLPLGAVVASCTLADRVPIIDLANRSHDGSSHIAEYPSEGGLEHQQGGLWLIGTNKRTHGHPTRIEDQHPFGDFSPGRWAWLLEDVKPTTERCPACWGTGGEWGMAGVCFDIDGQPWHAPGSCPHCGVCPVCGGAGKCDPIPARGKQRLWEWEAA